MSTPPQQPSRSRLRVGEALLQEGVLTEDQLRHALAQQKSSGQMLGEMLVTQGVITNAVLVRALAKCLGVRGCQLRFSSVSRPNRPGPRCARS